MTLNLKQISHRVKFSPTALIPNPANLLGLNECYKRLKALGWTSSNEVHPTGRTSLFRFGGATIHHDKTNPGNWIVEVAGGSYSVTGDLKEITTEAVKFDLMARCDPAPRSGKPTKEEIQRGYDFALSANHLNRKAPHYSQWRGIGHR